MFVVKPEQSCPYPPNSPTNLIRQWQKLSLHTKFRVPNGCSAAVGLMPYRAHKDIAMLQRRVASDARMQFSKGL